MVNVKKIGLAIIQTLGGCLSGVLAGAIALFLIDLIWRGIQETNGFIAAILLIVSFLVIYAAAVVATAEVVKQIGRLFIPRQTSRRRIYEWSFLGTCAAVAILTVTRADWISTLEEWGGVIQTLGTVLYYVVVRPVYFLIYWIPAIFLLVVAGPIGAVLAYNLPEPKKKASKTGENEQSHDLAGGRNESTKR